MAATYFTLLTKIGQASIANAVALNKPVNLTYMAVGDGNGNPTTPNENQTTLVREKYRAQINQLTVDDDNPNYLIAELIVPTTVGGWSIHEVGVFDDQSQLVAVANFPATYKPELAEGSGRDLIVRIVIQVSNTSVVTLKVDPAVILASQAWVAANYVKKITVAGGTTGQVLAKKSNANEDFKWVDPTAAVQVIVDSQTEEQTLASGQTIINLAKLTTQATAIYVEGVRLYPVTHYTINSDTRLTLKTSYPNGSKVLAVQNDPTSAIAMASLTDKGFTILSSETNSDDETKAATPKAVKAVSSGRLLRVVAITASGSYTVGAGTKKIKVIATGGGGGGGGSSGTTDVNSTRSGAGGGAGGTTIGIFDVTPGTALSATIGNGGVAGVGSQGGGNGGGTSLGSIISASGGYGASWAASGTTAGGDGGGGSSSQGLAIRGGYGSDGQSGGRFLFAGNGGASFWGGGGRAGSGSGGAGRAYGSGGAGSYDESGAAKAGGVGMSGVIYIEEYA